MGGVVKRPFLLSETLRTLKGLSRRSHEARFEAVSRIFKQNRGTTLSTRSARAGKSRASVPLGLVPSRTQKGDLVGRYPGGLLLR